MDDIVGFIIVFVIFVLGPLIEQMRKKQLPPPPQRRPTPSTRPQSETPSRPARVKNPQVAYPEPQARHRGAEAERESAATMLPPDLWEVLTGEKRPTPVPLPAPPDVEVESFEDEAEPYEDITASTRRGRMEEIRLPEAIVHRAEPVVVSMETMPDPRQRHIDFHKRIEQPPPTPVAPAVQWLSTPGELRRAFIVQTILAPPKALE